MKCRHFEANYLYEIAQCIDMCAMSKTSVTLITRAAVFAIAENRSCVLYYSTTVALIVLSQIDRKKKKVPYKKKK